MSRYDLTDFEWRVIEPLLPNKPRGVLRVDDRRVLNGIFWVLRSGTPWRDRLVPRTIVLGDKPVLSEVEGAYDAGSIRDLIEAQGAVPNIPPKSNRKWKPCFSKTLYRQRNLVERFFSKLKHFRRIATRYDKALLSEVERLAENFLAMVKLASMRLWLRAYESTA